MPEINTPETDTPEIDNHVLPLLPLTTGVVLPGMVVTLTIESDEAAAAVEAADGGELLLVPRLDGRYARIGTVAKVEDVGRLRGGQEALVIRGLHRAAVGLGVPGTGDAGPDHGADQPSDHEGLEPAAEPPHVLDLGDGADLRVARADPGDEQELAVGGLGGGERAPGLVGLDREGHDHARQDHARGERQERQDLGVELCHVGFSSKSRLGRINALLRHGIPRV